MNKYGKRTLGKHETEISQMIGKGDSYTSVARKFKVSTTSVMGFCKRRGIISKYECPKQLCKKKKTFWQRLWG